MVQEIARYDGKIKEVVKPSKEVNTEYFASLSYFVFGTVAVVWFGVRLSISGEMSVGQLISFVLYSTL
jgi:ABC-type bacteriocin/lantibiotic exporter with double-glycine peptidase domain